MTMLKCDLHFHTTESDGKHTPEEMLAEYERQGFDVVAVTDHDKWTQVSHDRILIVPATEFTYAPDDHKKNILKHILMLFIREMPRSVADARHQNALMYVAHPATWPQSPRTFPEGMDGVESVNGMYRVKKGCLGVMLWNREQSRWKGWRQLGNSDAHDREHIGKVYTMIDAEGNLGSIREALMNGRTRIVTA